MGVSVFDFFMESMNGGNGKKPTCVVHGKEIEGVSLSTLVGPVCSRGKLVYRRALDLARAEVRGGNGENISPIHGTPLDTVAVREATRRFLESLISSKLGRVPLHCGEAERLG